MRDPFRPNSNKQLVREAQIGFTIICTLVCLLIYVAWFRLSGRFDQVPDHILNAPVAKNVSPEDWQKQLASQAVDRESSPITKSPMVEKLPPVISSQVKAPFVSNPAVAPSTKTPGGKKSGIELVSNNFKTETQPKKTPAASRIKSFTPATEFNPSATNFSTRKLPPIKPQTKLAPSNKPIAPVDIQKTDRSFTKVTAPKTANRKQPLTTSPFVVQPALKTKSRSKAKPYRVLSPDEDRIVIPLSQPETFPEIHLPRGSFDSSSLPHPDEPFDLEEEPVRQVNFEALVNTQPVETTKQSNSELRGKYIIQDGDNFWSIAQKQYKDGRYFRALFEFNRSVVPDYEILKPGTQLEIPDLETLQRQLPELCPRDEPKPNAALETLKRDREAPAPLQIYQTNAGDTLYEISRQKLGQASRYVEILRLNESRLQPNVDQLAPLPEGVRLVLPSAAQ